MYASATNPPAKIAAWAIHLKYPVARDRIVAAEIESTDRRMPDIRARLLRRLSALQVCRGLHPDDE
ncbi:MAG TPA: hypothetical protein VNB92_07355, partial [Rubrobacter sp.]|nr:hypothetical protein [Rubrobacter sp.]